MFQNELLFEAFNYSINFGIFSPLRQIVSTIAADTKYASILLAGLLSSKYPYPNYSVKTGILTLDPLFLDLYEKVCILEVSW